MDLKIGSINVSDLGDNQNRREMFNWLQTKNFSVYFLQEVHCTENITPTWAAEWGYEALFSCCTSAKGGVAILFKNNFGFQIQKVYMDTSGRFIICDVKIEERCITLATLYAPNDLLSIKIF